MGKSIRPLPSLGAILCVLFIVNCSKKDSGTTTPTPAPAKSSEAKLQSFEFKKIANSFLTQDYTATIDESAKTINVALPALTPITNLTPNFTVSAKASVKVAGTTQTSGTSANDFTNPVSYVVIAEDGTQQSYSVKVSITNSTEAKLTGFSFKKQYNPALTQDYAAIIDEANKKISVSLPVFTTVNSLIASFIASPAAAVKVAGLNQQTDVTPNNFSSPLNYTVIAQDGTTTQTYTVTVNVANSTEAKLSDFSFKKQYNPSLPQDYAGTIDEANKKISISLPPFTAVNNLIASFTSSQSAAVKVGATTQQSNITPNNFSSPLNYSVTAQDGTTSQTYTVTANVPLSDSASILSFSFSKNNNSVITKDINGLITIDDKEIHLRNPYLNKSNFVPTFSVSRGATVKVNGVTQISGSTSNDFSTIVNYDVIAQTGRVHTYKIKTTAHILKFDEFIAECPLNDPNINQILSDFEIRVDGNRVTNFPCTDPYYPQTQAQFYDEVKWLQTLRILYYLDYGQSNHLPWTNFRIYDWIRIKIGGINIVTGTNGGYCCTNFNGKTFINVGKLKGNSFGNFAEIPSLYYAWSMNNFALLLHETRHVEGYAHSNCCPAGANRCDNQYDINNLSPYALHIWWYKAVLNRQFDFGFNCLPESVIKSIIDISWNSMNNQNSNFCTPATIPAKPAYWNDCNYK